MDSTASISRSMGRFFSGTMVSRVTGLLRDVALAFFFGSTPSVAAFLMAFRFANLPRRLFGEGAMHAAFVPAYEDLRVKNPERATTFFRDLTTTLTLFLIALVGVGTALLFLFRPTNPSNREVVDLTLLVLPALLPICLYGLNAAFLNCEKSYFRPSVAPAAFNLTLLIAICTSHSVSVLAATVIFAFSMQWLLTIPWGHFGWGRPFSADVRKVGKPLLLGILGVSATQINNLLDPIFARAISLEGPAHLWYALRLEQLPVGLLGVALTGALLPPLARAYKSGDLDQYNTFLTYSLRKATLLMIPATLALLTLGFPAINLIYGHGAFTLDATVATTLCLQAYALGLLPTILTLIQAAGHYARGDYRTPAIASVLAVALNIVLNILFAFILHLGVASVALATALSAWGQCFFLRRGLLWKESLKIFVPALFASLAALTPALFIPPSRNLTDQLTLFAFQGGLFATLLLLLSPDLRKIIKSFV